MCFTALLSCLGLKYQDGNSVFYIQFMHHAHLLFAEIVYQAKTIRNHGHVKIELWLLLSCIGLDKCPNFPPSECACILLPPFVSHLALTCLPATLNFKILFYLHAPLLPVLPSALHIRHWAKWKGGNRWHDQVTQNWEMVGMQTRCLMLDLNRGGGKLCSWGWERVRGGRDEEEEEVPLREKETAGKNWLWGEIRGRQRMQLLE